MNPKFLLQAKGHEGVVTVLAPFNGFPVVVLGASCFTSVKATDGLVSSFAIRPEQEKEVVAVALMNCCSMKVEEHYIEETFLLAVSFSDGKAFIDLEFPFMSSAESIGQIVHNRQACILNISKSDGEVRSSRCIRLVPIEPEFAPGPSTDELCRVLVGKESCKIPVDKQLIPTVCSIVTEVKLPWWKRLFNCCFGNR